MRDERRRDLLRKLGLGAVLGLAGCQGDGAGEDPDEGPDTASTSERTAESTTTESTASSLSPTYDLDTAVESGEDAQRLRVTGEIVADSALDSVAVAVGEASTRVDAGGATEITLDAALRVEGGRSYQVAVTVVDERGSEAGTSVETGHVPIHVDPLETDRLVGAHYYPWYEMSGGHENWTERTVADPVLGEYAADDREVIDRHLQWCLEHGIRWLSTSWWGPDSGSDAVLSETMLSMERFRDVQFSVLYESVGRLEAFDYDFDDPDARRRLSEDFRYLADEYFGEENYYHVDGRPVVFFYVANHFRGDVEGAFGDAAAAAGVDPYVLVDVPFGSAPATYPVLDVADAITSYNPYTARPDIESVFHDQYEHGNKVMHLGAETAGVDYVPVVIPGFNDTGLPERIREDNPVLSASPSRYERVCEQVAPHLADAEAVLVTSFNEWYENTQVEPGEEFGTEYLELTADALATGASPGFDVAGATLRLAFDETVVPAKVNPDSSDERALAFLATRLAFLDGGETVASFDVGDAANEPLFLEGAYGASSDAEASWRWFGGADAETVLFVEADLSGVDRAVLTGEPMRSNEIEADVYFDGERTDHVAFGERDGTVDDYELSLQ